MLTRVSEDTQKIQFNTHNQVVPGSSPGGTTIKTKNSCKSMIYESFFILGHKLEVSKVYLSEENTLFSFMLFHNSNQMNLTLKVYNLLFL